MCPCGKAVKSRTHTVGEYEIYEEERDAIEEMTTTDEWDTEKFGTLDSSEKTIVILGDRWWPCLLYTSPSPRDRQKSRMPSSA